MQEEHWRYETPAIPCRKFMLKISEFVDNLTAWSSSYAQQALIGSDHANCYFKMTLSLSKAMFRVLERCFQASMMSDSDRKDLEWEQFAESDTSMLPWYTQLWISVFNIAARSYFYWTSQFLYIWNFFEHFELFNSLKSLSQAESTRLWFDRVDNCVILINIHCCICSDVMKSSTANIWTISWNVNQNTFQNRSCHLIRLYSLLDKNRYRNISSLTNLKDLNNNSLSVFIFVLLFRTLQYYCRFVAIFVFSDDCGSNNHPLGRMWAINPTIYSHSIRFQTFFIKYRHNTAIISLSRISDQNCLNHISIDFWNINKMTQFLLNSFQYS